VRIALEREESLCWAAPEIKYLPYCLREACPRLRVVNHPAKKTGYAQDSDMRVMLKNEKSGELKEVKVGWSWVLFLFSGFLGIPLFLRRLNGLGLVFLVLWAAYLFFQSDNVGPNAALALGSIIILSFAGLVSKVTS
jgi:hypothetical protein